MKNECESDGNDGNNDKLMNNDINNMNNGIIYKSLSYKLIDSEYIKKYIKFIDFFLIFMKIIFLILN